MNYKEKVFWMYHRAGLEVIMWSVNVSYRRLKLYLNFEWLAPCHSPVRVFGRRRLACTAVCSQDSVSVWHMDISNGWRKMECDIYRETRSRAKLGIIRGEPEVQQVAVNIRFQTVISVQWRRTTDQSQDFVKLFLSPQIVPIVPYFYMKTDKLKTLPEKRLLLFYSIKPQFSTIQYAWYCVGIMLYWKHLWTIMELWYS